MEESRKKGVEGEREEEEQGREEKQGQHERSWLVCGEIVVVVVVVDSYMM